MAGGSQPPVGAQRHPESPSPGPALLVGARWSRAALGDAESERARTREGFRLLPTRSLGMRCHFDDISLFGVILWLGEI